MNRIRHRPPLLLDDENLKSLVKSGVFLWKACAYVKKALITEALIQCNNMKFNSARLLGVTSLTFKNALEVIDGLDDDLLNLDHENIKDIVGSGSIYTYKMVLNEFKKAYIETALDINGGDQGVTAIALGCGRVTVFRYSDEKKRKGRK